MPKASPSEKKKSAVVKPALVRVVWNGSGRLRIPVDGGKMVTLSHGEPVELPVAVVDTLRAQGITIEVEGN